MGDAIKQILNAANAPIPPEMPAGAYPVINVFTGNPMAGGWYLDGGICPLYEEYAEIERPTFPQGPELIEESEV